MLKATFATFIPVAIFYLALGILNLKDMRWRREIQKRNRRSPLTKSMLRSPGESLRNEIDELEVDHRAFLMLALSFPFIVLSFGYLKPYLSTFRYGIGSCTRRQQLLFLYFGR